MRLVIDDPAGQGRSIASEQLPVSIGLDSEGPHAQPREERAWLNGQPLVERRYLAHGDVLRSGELYLFVCRDEAGFRLMVDRQTGVAVEPPLPEPGEAEEELGPDVPLRAIRPAAIQPLPQVRATRKQRLPLRRWVLLAILTGSVAFLWMPRSKPPPVVSPLPPPESVPQEPASPSPPVTPRADIRTDNQTNDAIPSTESSPQKTPGAVKPVLAVGQVTVRGEPADAQVFIEGEAKGSAGKTLALPATALQLEVRREGYQTFATSVTPQPGFPRIVEYRLQTPEQAQAERFPAAIKTSTGIELRLMPTGRFEMGSARGDAGSRANESRRAVTLQRRFYLGTREITNADYLRFRPEHLSGIVKDRSLDQDTHPVVNVSWREAAEFCNWLSVQEGLTPAYSQSGDTLTLVSPVTTGYRLPTEAEWEWSARYERGEAVRRYPWGQDLPPPPASGNYADRSSLTVLEAAFEGYDDGFPTTAPVGRFSQNSLGLFDIGGNVSEWTNDFYTVYRELDSNSATDPTGPASGTSHVIRGSNWRTASVTELRLPWREAAGDKSQTIGFRIARYAE